jgi:hypothetical protein
MCGSWDDPPGGGEFLLSLWHDAEGHASGEKVLPHDALHIGGGHGAVAVEVLLEVVGIAGRVVVGVELVGLVVGELEAVEEGGLDGVLGLSEFAGGRRARGELADLDVDEGLEGVKAKPGRAVATMPKSPSSRSEELKAFALVATSFW